MSVERSEPIRYIHNLFPISEQSATTSFESIMGALETGRVDILDDKVKQFKKENTVLFYRLSVAAIMLYELTKDEDVMDLYLVGALLGYTTLREEAIRRGGALPVISDDILKTRIMDVIDIEQNREKLVNANSEKDLDSFSKILEEGKAKMVDNFFQQEPELGAVSKKYLSGFKKVHAETIQSAILFVYSVFRTNHEIEEFRSQFSM